jgi:Prokaryotic E2 family E
MSLLFEEDYAKLKDRGLSYEENEQNRFFIFTQYQLPVELYTVSACDVLVVIPPNYNQAGNDMFWTFPKLVRVDGKPIPNINDPGVGDNRIWKDREFCRWSRHWNPPSPSIWRPGKDDIISIYRRIDWALRKPDAQ